MRTQRPYLQCPGLPGCNELSLSCFPRSGAQTKLGDFEFWIWHRPNSVLFYIGRSNNSSLTFETPTNGRQGRGNKSGEGSQNSFDWNHDSQHFDCRHFPNANNTHQSTSSPSSSLSVTAVCLPGPTSDRLCTHSGEVFIRED